MCRFVGVDKMFLRENGFYNSTIEEQLQPYSDAGVVDFAFLPGTKHPTQTNWFNECARLTKPKFTWVAFIDVDEFIVVLNKCASCGCIYICEHRVYSKAAAQA